MKLETIRKILILLVPLLMLLVVPQRGKAAQDEPLAQVKESVEAILAILNNQQLSQPGREKEREEQIMAVVQNRFDFREMSKMTLTRHWRDLSESEREHFVDLFAQLLKNTYIVRVERYNQKEVRVDFKNQEIRGDKAMVKTVVIADSTETPIDYRLRKEGPKWAVYDVVIEGVSLIRNYRTQFTQIIEKEKFAGLLKRIQEKINSDEAPRS